MGVSAKQLKEDAKNVGVLYVEDDEAVRTNTLSLLSQIFNRIETAKDGQEGLTKYREASYDIVISDINMPVLNGIDMVREIKALNSEQHVIITSAHDEANYLLSLINMGVNSFIVKPLDFKPFLETLAKVVKFVNLELMAKDYTRILEKTVEKSTKDLSEALELVNDLSRELVFRLTSAAEYRDNDTGKHILRVGLYTKVISEYLGMDREFVESMVFSSSLHDIGKIGIPDEILLKHGPLSRDEFNIMKRHSEIGKEILSGSRHINVKIGEKIALAHHERYDGGGYPEGLKAEAIPIEARILNLCDQYDALRSERPYKPPFSHEKTCSIILEGDGRTTPEHFDPKVLDAFAQNANRFKDIFDMNADEEGNFSER